MEKHTIIALSTAHIKKETADLLNNDSIGQIVVYQKGNYGWFVPVPDNMDELQDTIPEDLYGCIKYAVNHQADWIMFDCDVDTNENHELPIYNWD